MDTLLDTTAEPAPIEQLIQQLGLLNQPMSSPQLEPIVHTSSMGGQSVWRPCVDAPAAFSLLTTACAQQKYEVARHCTSPLPAAAAGTALPESAGELDPEYESAKLGEDCDVDLSDSMKMTNWAKMRGHARSMHEKSKRGACCAPFRLVVR